MGGGEEGAGERRGEERKKANEEREEGATSEGARKVPLAALSHFKARVQFSAGALRCRVRRWVEETKCGGVLVSGPE